MSTASDSAHVPEQEMERRSNASAEMVAKSSVARVEDAVSHAGRCRLDTGDFIVKSRWSSEAGGTMSIEVGDHVYITEVDPSGWAQGTILSSGRKGWVPYAFLQRCVRTAVLETSRQQ